MEEKKCEIKEVLFWGDEIFKPGDLVILQDKCENVFKGRIVSLKKGSESGKESYSGKAHIVLDMSGTYNSEQVPIILEEIEVLEHGQAGSDNSYGCNPDCTCGTGGGQSSGTDPNPDSGANQTPDTNPDKVDGGEDTPNAE